MERVMKGQNEPYIRELTWAEARDDVHKVCAEITTIIDNINPGKDLTFISVKYPFGANIVHKGTANITSYDSSIIPITDSQLPAAIRNKLNYNLVPLGIVVKGGIEVFAETDSRIFCVAAWRQGFDIGIWEYFDWRTPYGVTAGARSLYLLPKVTLSQGHKQLKRKYDITCPPPKQSFDHWNVLKQIANSPKFKENWECEVLYLTKNWIEKFKLDDPHWNKLHNYILQRGWAHSDYARKKSIFDIVWQSFSKSIHSKGVKANSYVIDTLKHLAFIGLGVLPASQPTIGSNILVPSNELQHIYAEIYGLNDYIPTIMQPGYLSFDNATRPVYYTLQTPTLLESVPQSRNMVSLIDNIRELKELADHFLVEAFDPHLKIKNISISKLINQLKFEFFHEESYAYGKDIRPSHEMPDKDPTLLYMSGNRGNRKFADKSPYLHGCVRISVKGK